MENPIGSDAISQDTLIDQYLKGKMTPEEEHCFLEQLQGDVQLKQRAVAMARMIKAMETVGRRRDSELRQELSAVAADASLGEKLKQATNPLFSPAENAMPAMARKKDDRAWASANNSRSWRRRILTTLSAAASIIVCLWGGYSVYDNYRVRSLSQEYLAYFPSSTYTRGSAGPAEQEVAQLYSMIAEGRVDDNTLVRLRELWMLSQQDVYNDYTDYSLQIGWMLANAYLRDNKKSEAIQVLASLIRQASPGSAMALKAQELKSRIEKL